MTQKQREQAARVLDNAVKEIRAYRVSLMFSGSDDYYQELVDKAGAETSALDTAIAALREPEWVRTADRLPDGNEHDDVLGLYKGLDYLMYDIVQIGWLRLHPEMYVFWTRLPEKPEVEE